MSNRSILIRFTLIGTLVSLADAIFVWFAAKPLPWAAVIPAFIPLLIVIFVVLPHQRERKS